MGEQRKANWWRQYTRDRLENPKDVELDTYEQFAHKQIRGASIRERAGMFWQFTKFFFVALLLSYQLLKTVKPKKKTNA